VGHMAEMTELTSEAELRELLGTPARRSATKVRPVLHARDRDWCALIAATAVAELSGVVGPPADHAAGRAHGAGVPLARRQRDRVGTQGHRHARLASGGHAQESLKWS